MNGVMLNRLIAAGGIALLFAPTLAFASEPDVEPIVVAMAPTATLLPMAPLGVGPSGFAGSQGTVDRAVATASRAERKHKRKRLPESVRRVLRFALKQLGKPYRWGGSGPEAWDCSGLTMAAWAQAGVHLPRTAAEQYAVSPHVSRSHLRPGDLLFFGSPIHHVGIYTGGSSILNAPYTADSVEFDNWTSRSDFAGAARPRR